MNFVGKTSDFAGKNEKKKRIMLLGPGGPNLSARRQTASKLLFWYDPIIMEDDQRGPESEGGIDNLFEKFCKSEPYLFVAFFYTGADLGAVKEEISFLRNRYGSFFDNKLITIREPSFNFDELSAYTKEMCQRIPCYEFDESKAHKQPHLVIHKHVLNMLKQQKELEQQKERKPRKTLLARILGFFGPLF